MEFYEAVRKRRTVRESDDKPVEEAKLRRVLAAGLMAPANGHLKNWEYILLRDPAERRRALAALGARNLTDAKAIEELVTPFQSEELRNVYRRSLPVQLTMLLEAPELLVVCYRRGKPLAEARSLFDFNSLASVWCAIENIVLAMAAEGLYGCTYSPYDTGNLKRHLGLPDGLEIAALIPVGYPKAEPAESASPNLDARIHVDGWQKSGG